MTHDEPHRIPYHVWNNSPLSVARHYGGCTVNGREYRLDMANARTEVVDGEVRYFPDLVAVVKPVKKRKAKATTNATNLFEADKAKGEL